MGHFHLGQDYPRLGASKGRAAHIYSDNLDKECPLVTQKSLLSRASNRFVPPVHSARGTRQQCPRGHHKHRFTGSFPRRFPRSRRRGRAITAGRCCIVHRSRATLRRPRRTLTHSLPGRDPGRGGRPTPPCQPMGRRGVGGDDMGHRRRRHGSAFGLSGMEVERESALGVVARFPGSGGGRTLLIDGHTDVVPPGDIGAWTGDPSFRAPCSATAATPSWPRRLRHESWTRRRMGSTPGCSPIGRAVARDVLLCPVSGEEDGGLGTYAALEHLVGTPIAGCIVPEPTNLDLVPANAGTLTFRLTVNGAAIHASRRSEGVSAVEKFVPVLAALSHLEAVRNASVDELMQRWPVAYPLSIGTVHAGDWASTVPDLLVAGKPARRRPGRVGGQRSRRTRSSRRRCVSFGCVVARAP